MTRESREWVCDWEFGLRLRSWPNLRWHWRRKHKVEKEQRKWACYCTTHAMPPDAILGDWVTATIVRVGMRAMDSDNLARSAKAVRDGIADALGIDDGDPRIDWRYGQAILGRYGVQVWLQSAATLCDRDCNHCPIVLHRNSRMLTQILHEAHARWGAEFRRIVERRCPNLTCCAACHVDDFAHVAGCSLGDKSREEGDS